MAVDGVHHKRIQQAQKSVVDAERRASKQIQHAEKRVREAQLQADRRIDDIKDQYIERSAQERDRQDFQYSRLKQKGNDNVDELRRKVRAHINNTKNQSEKDIRTVEDYYKHQIYETKRKGDKDLKSEQNLYLAARENEKQKSQVELEALKLNQIQQLENYRDLHKTRMQDTRDASQKEYQNLKQNYLQAKEKSNKVFSENLKESTMAHKLTLDRINRAASQEIRDINAHYSRSLDNYNSRQSDPFYQMVRIDGTVEEASDGYVFYAPIPKHEQDEITVNIQDNQLIVSGTRRSKEHREEQDSGKKITTTSFQSYHETFPLDFPVDARNLKKEFDGDYLLVTVPKQTRKQRPTYQKPDPEQKELKVPRPKFPDGVEPKPTAKTQQSDHSSDEDNIHQTDYDPGDFTLS